MLLWWHIWFTRSKHPPTHMWIWGFVVCFDLFRFLVVSCLCWGERGMMIPTDNDLMAWGILTKLAQNVWMCMYVHVCVCQVWPHKSIPSNGTLQISDNYRAGCGKGELKGIVQAKNLNSALQTYGNLFPSWNRN